MKEVRIAGLSIRSEAEDEPERVVEKMNKQMVSNARLMAAAPELAELLIEACEFEESNEWDGVEWLSKFRDRARAALEKAGWKP